ncbi:MAG: nickel-responsive transcriptional regulator NikR [bacterium]
MSGLVRFGVSIEGDLLDAFDEQNRRRSYHNRSEAIRDLIRTSLAEEEWAEDGQGAGGIVVVYDHHRKELADRLVDIQHDALDIVVSNLHVHLDHHNCLEVIVVKGQAERITRLADELRSLKGVSHCSVARVGLFG